MHRQSYTHIHTNTRTHTPTHKYTCTQTNAHTNKQTHTNKQIYTSTQHTQLTRSCTSRSPLCTKTGNLSTNASPTSSTSSGVP